MATAAVAGRAANTDPNMWNVLHRQSVVAAPTIPNTTSCTEFDYQNAMNTQLPLNSNSYPKTDFHK